MKFAASCFLAFLSATPSYASCFGASSLYTCNDSSGNHYSVSKLGGMTTVHGSNATNGTSWDETTTDMGAMTTTRGTASNGQSWNMTQMDLGGGFYTQSGTDSDGNSFSYFCGPNGCH